MCNLSVCSYRGKLINAKFLAVDLEFFAITRRDQITNKNYRLLTYLSKPSSLAGPIDLLFIHLNEYRLQDQSTSYSMATETSL